MNMVVEKRRALQLNETNAKTLCWAFEKVLLAGETDLRVREPNVEVWTKWSYQLARPGDWVVQTGPGTVEVLTEEAFQSRFPPSSPHP